MWNYPFHALICAHLGCQRSIRRRQSSKQAAVSELRGLNCLPKRAGREQSQSICPRPTDGMVSLGWSPHEPYRGVHRGAFRESIFLFCSLQLSLWIIQFRSKDTRCFWTHVPALAGCHQTLLACPWSSYLYRDQVHVWSGSPFRFSVASLGHILFLSSFFRTVTSRQNTHKK